MRLYKYEDVPDKKTASELKARDGRGKGRLTVPGTIEEKGCQILHDIPGGNFNIDHLLVGRAGIYVIETKTISKPQSGKAVIEYNGKELKVNGFTPDRNPIAQAQALGKGGCP